MFRKTLAIVAHSWCGFQDDSGAMNMRLFHYSYKQKATLERASWIRCFGEAASVKTRFGNGPSGVCDFSSSTVWTTG